MRATAALPAILVILVLSLPAGAEACVPSDASSPEACFYERGGPLPCDRRLTELLGDVRFYLDRDDCEPECIFSIWFYEESNGIFWLQRDDDLVDNTCNGMIEPDSVIF